MSRATWKIIVVALAVALTLFTIYASGEIRDAREWPTLAAVWVVAAAIAWALRPKR